MRLARELRPAVITLDVLMPGMDGWQVLAALKADPALADVPVIMLTMLDDRDMGYALGAAAFMTKPVDRERLVALLRQYRREGPAGPVLIVEDDAATRDMLRRSLEKAGWTTAQAEHGRAALARVAEQQPAVILLDLMMPEMDGFQFVTELRKTPAWRTIPIIVITAKARALDGIEDLRALRIVDYLYKPFEISDLLEKIGKAMKSRGGA